MSRRTGCGVQVDINNLCLKECNHYEDTWLTLAALTSNMIFELHLGLS
ncbi:multinuclear nonheme iron-dependent oxidase [Paraburkholderia gardini]